jgi:hypothetical protein
VSDFIYQSNRLLFITTAVSFVLMSQNAVQIIWIFLIVSNQKKAIIMISLT